MRIGVCGGPNEWPVIAELGYDYCEGNFSYLSTLDEESFLSVRHKLESTGLKAECFNCFFDSSVCIYTCSGKWLNEYLKRTFDRASLLGGEIAVIGSGQARRIPDSMTLADAENRFAEILYTAAEISKAVGMRIVIEPLSFKDCNFINTLTDGISMCKKVNHPSIGTLLDFYHFYANGESLDELKDAGLYLQHTHIARPDPDRNAPGPLDSMAIMNYAQALKSIGYDDRISLECIWKPDFVTALKRAYPVMLEFKRVVES